MGATFLTTANSIRASTGAQTKNTIASLAFIIKERLTPMISMIGLLIRGLKPPFMAFWITVTSVVIRVISDEVSNLSKFENA